MAANQQRNGGIAIDVLDYARNVCMPQLQAPDHPQCCPLCLPLFMRALFQPPAQPYLEELLINDHEFFGACARMLTAPRLASDLARLQRVLRDNTSRCSTSAWHQLAHRRNNNELELFLFSLYTCLLNAVGIGPRPVKTSTAFAQRARKGHWPTALDQLLPFGAQESINSHLFWCHTLIVTPLDLIFLNKLLDIARPTLVPHLLSDPQRDVLVLDLLRMLRVGYSHAQGPEDARDEYQVLAGNWAHQVGAGPLIVEAAVRFLQTVDSGPDAQIYDIQKFYAGRERAVYVTLLAVADANILRDDSTRYAVASMASSLHALLRLPHPLHPAIAGYRQKVQVVPNQKDYTPGHFVFLILSQRAGLRKCAGPGCMRVAAATRPEDPGKLQACARCGFVRYCSRGCQQADWREKADAEGGARAPHKALCPILCKLWQAGADVNAQTTKEFVAIYDRAGIDSANFETLQLWASSSGLVGEPLNKIIFGSLEHGILYGPD